MNVLILGNMSDMQTGIYILEAFGTNISNVDAIDIRKMSDDLGVVKTQEIIFEELKAFTVNPTNNYSNEPNLIVVMKGLELSYDTIKSIKEIYPKAILVNWFFDVHLGAKPIWEHTEYFKTLKLYDYYFCNHPGVAEKLNEIGFDNTMPLKEACSIKFHKQTYMNAFQKKKYGEDITFIGSVGFHIQHPNRIPTLMNVLHAGFNMKIWGDQVGLEKNIPTDIKHARTGISAINEQHSMIAQSSLINLGIDGNPEYGCGARMYRIMCAGGLYLNNYTKEIEKTFKINKEGENITENQDLVIYYNNEDLINKLDFLLENEDLCKKIAENGMKKVQKEHTFDIRVKDMLDIVKKDIVEKNKK